MNDKIIGFMLLSIFILGAGIKIGEIQGRQIEKECILNYGVNYSSAKYKAPLDHCGGLCYPNNITEEEFRKHSYCSYIA